MKIRTAICLCFQKLKAGSPYSFLLQNDKMGKIPQLLHCNQATQSPISCKEISLVILGENKVLPTFPLHTEVQSVYFYPFNNILF